MTLQQNEGDAVVAAFQVPVLAQFRAGLKGFEGGGIKDGELLPGDIAADFILLLQEVQPLPGGNADFAALPEEP